MTSSKKGSMFNMIAPGLLAGLFMSQQMVDIGRVSSDNAYELAHDAYEVSLEEKPLFLDKDESVARFRTMKLLIVWDGFESGHRCSVVGDGGNSIGSMQFGHRWLSHASLSGFEATPKMVLTNCKLAMRMGLSFMRWLRDEPCTGSVKRALNAYASGSCYGSLSVRAKVEERCVLAGGC